MFDVAPSELLIVGIAALIFIGPKDLPKAMQVIGRFIGRARGLASQFRAGFDSIVREAELEEMEKKWKAENERIMREYGAAYGQPETQAASALPAPELATDTPPAPDSAVDLSKPA